MVTGTERLSQSSGGCVCWRERSLETLLVTDGWKSSSSLMVESVVRPHIQDFTRSLQHGALKVMPEVQ